jgi:hypothetical protein
MGAGRFTNTIRNAIFNMAPTVLDRAPSRWRKDANGRTVLFALWGKNRVCGWQPDHILPKTLKGSDSLENC